MGEVAWIVVTNSDHVRATAEWREATGAEIAGPSGERDAFPVKCDRWVGEGDDIVEGLSVIEMQGSKTPGELALVLERETLITGDLVRGQRAGQLNILPPEKLTDPKAAAASVQRLANLEDIWAVLPGDGWPVFHGGHESLQQLAKKLAEELASPEA